MREKGKTNSFSSAMHSAPPLSLRERVAEGRVRGKGFLRASVVVVLLLLSGCAFVKIPLTPEVRGVEEQVVGGSGKAKIAIVEISGILSLGRFGLDRFSKEPPQVPRFREELEAAIADGAVAGLVVRIDSPGGSVTASDILYHEITEFRRKKKVPVVACVMDRALSGGYYAALASEEIIIHPTSVVGAVGVISWRLDITQMLNTWGVKVDTVKSGPLKDFWSPLRGLNPAEEAIMEEITDEMHQRFLVLVQESRKLPPEILETVATGRIFGAGTALKLGLADRTGYLDDAVARVRELAGLTEARTVIYRRPGAYRANMYAGDPFLLRELSVLENAASEWLMPSFRYQAP